MRLYLVRHGEAGPAPLDSERTLTAAGRASVVRLADRAAAVGVRPEQIRHSGLVRARETAEILAAWLAPPAGVAEMSHLLPEDDEEIAAVELGLLGASTLVVGHMPFLARLTGRLLGGRRGVPAASYTTAELRGLERDGAIWNQFLGLSGSLNG